MARSCAYTKNANTTTPTVCGAFKTVCSSASGTHDSRSTPGMEHNTAPCSDSTPLAPPPIPTVGGNIHKGCSAARDTQTSNSALGAKHVTVPSQHFTMDAKPPIQIVCGHSNPSNNNHNCAGHSNPSNKNHSYAGHTTAPSKACIAPNGTNLPIQTDGTTITSAPIQI